MIKDKLQMGANLQNWRNKFSMAAMSTSTEVEINFERCKKIT